MEEITITAISNFLYQIISYLPNIFSSLILVAIGILIGKVVSRIVEELLERSKIENYLLGKRVIGISSIFSLLVGWSIYLIFIKLGLDVLGIEYISKIVETLNYFIGRVILFLVAILVGLGVSNYIKKRIEESEIEFKSFISKVVYYVCIYIVLVMCLPILGIDTTLLSLLFLLLVASFILPLSISLALAIRDEIKPVLRKYIRKGRKINRRKK